MLYNSLTLNELERAIYIDPANTAARADMLARVPDFIDQQHEDIQIAEQDAERLRKELDESEEEVTRADDTITALVTELEAAKDRIAELTSPAGLL